MNKDLLAYLKHSGVHLEVYSLVDHWYASIKLNTECACITGVSMDLDCATDYLYEHLKRLGVV